MEIKRYGEKEFLSADKLYIRENEIHIWCIRWPETVSYTHLKRRGWKAISKRRGVEPETGATVRIKCIAQYG